MWLVRLDCVRVSQIPDSQVLVSIFKVNDIFRDAKEITNPSCDRHEVSGGKRYVWRADTTSLRVREASKSNLNLEPLICRSSNLMVPKTAGN